MSEPTRMTRYRWTGWDINWAKDCEGTTDARDERDLRHRLVCEGRIMHWCAPLPPRPWCTIALVGVSLLLVPLVFLGLLPWYVPAGFGLLAAAGTEEEPKL